MNMNLLLSVSGALYLFGLVAFSIWVRRRKGMFFAASFVVLMICFYLWWFPFIFETLRVENANVALVTLSAFLIPGVPFLLLIIFIFCLEMRRSLSGNGS